MPRQSPPDTTPSADHQAQPEDRTVTVSFPISDSLHHALKIRAAQERTTLRGMMMKGLKLAGMDVPEADLLDRRPGRSGRKDRT